MEKENKINMKLMKEKKCNRESWQSESWFSEKANKMEWPFTMCIGKYASKNQNTNEQYYEFKIGLWWDIN